MRTYLGTILPSVLRRHTSLCRLLEIAECVCTLHIDCLAAVFVLLPSFLIPRNHNKATSSQSLLHNVMVREKSINIFLFAVMNSYVSEFNCIR
jgi:hypothetical protein